MGRKEPLWEKKEVKAGKMEKSSLPLPQGTYQNA